MPERCEGELCENWGGDSLVCPCALFGLEPSGPELLLAEIFDPTHPTGRSELSSEFPCPNCRKADGVHARGCLTLLAGQLDAQSGPDSREWLGHDR